MIRVIGKMAEYYSELFDQNFCMINHELYYLNEEDEWEPMTFNRQFDEVWCEDEEVLGDLGDIYVELEKALYE